MTSPDHTEPVAMEMYLEALQHDRVSEGLDVELSPTFGYVSNVERAESVRRHYERTMGIKFSTYRQSKDYGKEDIKVGHHKVCWEDSSRLRQGHLIFDHMPYIVIGIKMLDCQYGRDRHIARKKRSLSQSEAHQRKRKQGTGKKLDCPAQIYLRDILKFPDYAIDCNTVWRRKVMSEKLRKSLGTGSKVMGDRRIYIKFPEPSDHNGHQVSSGPCKIREGSVPNQTESLDCESITLSGINPKESEGRTDGGINPKESEGRTDEGINPKESEGRTDEGINPKESEGRTDGGINPKESEGKTDEGINPKESEGRTDEGINPKESEGRTDEGINPKESEGKTDGGINPKESEGRTDGGINPKESEGRTDEGINPKESEGRTDESINPKESEGRTDGGINAMESEGRTDVHSDKEQRDEQAGVHETRKNLDSSSHCQEHQIRYENVAQTVTRQPADCSRQIVDELQGNPSSGDTNQAMQCRRLLERLSDQTYSIQDSSILDALHQQLQDVLQNVLQAVEKVKQNRMMIPCGQSCTDQPTCSPLSLRLGASAEESVPDVGYKQPRKIVSKRTKRSCKCKERSNKVSPKAKRVERTEVVHDRLCTNQSVSSETMKEAQDLILDQFPLLHGFEDTTLGEHLLFSAAQGEFGQLMHDGKDHWIFVTSISCDPGTVKYYDSMGAQTIPDIIRKQIACIVCSHDTQISVEIQPVQLSNDVTDCGLIAIACAVSVLHSEDPALVWYDITCMRHHLYQCFQRRSLTPFPKTKRPVERTVKKVVSVDVFCLCRMPWNAIMHESRMKMAQCNVCGEWWHSNYCCIPDATNKHTWKCPRCEDVQSAVAALNSLQSAIL